VSAARRPFLLASSILALAALLSCGREPAAAPEVTQGEVHFLAFNRLQGFAEGIPCQPEGVPALAAAAAARDELVAAGRSTVLVLVGDTLLRTAALTDFRPIDVALRARGDVVLEALAAARPVFWVPGAADLRGENFGRVLARCDELGVPVLMSNVTAPEHPAIRSWIVVQDGTLRVGCLGLLPERVISLEALAQKKEGEERLVSPEFAEASVLPAADSVMRLCAELRERQGADLVVAFSDLGSKANTALTRDLGLDVIFGSTEADIGVDKMVNDNQVAIITSRPSGAELAHLVLRVVGGNMSFVDLGPMHTLPAQIERDAAELQQHIARHGTSDLEELARRVSPTDPAGFIRRATLIDENRQALVDFSAHEDSAIDHYAEALEPVAPDVPIETLLARQGEAIEAAFATAELKPLVPAAGPSAIPTAETCESCHPAQTAFWRATAHAQAWESLRARQRHHDPDCLKCHTNGYESKAGWLDPRDDAPLGPVSCWACHRTLTPHAAKAWKVVDPQFQGLGSVFNMTCENCHTEERSPGFDRQAVLPQVSCPKMHGDEPLILLARQAALDALAERRAAGEADERDEYLQARALVGLGREAEGFPLLDKVIEANTSDTSLAIEIARLCDEHGFSERALASLRAYLEHQSGDEAANWYYADLLLHARDATARAPDQAARHLALLLPPDARGSGPSFIDLRCLQVEALFHAGRKAEGQALLDALFIDHPTDERLLALRDKVAGL